MEPCSNFALSGHIHVVDKRGTQSYLKNQHIVEIILKALLINIWPQSVKGQWQEEGEYKNVFNCHGLKMT